MTPDTPSPIPLMAAVLVALAVLAWPRSAKPEGGLLGGRGRQAAEPTAVGTDPSAGAPRWTDSRRPVRRRRWRAFWRRRTHDGDVDGVLTLLDALGPALRAGLPPADALRAVGRAGPGPHEAVSGRSRAGHADATTDLTLDLIDDLLAAAERAEQLAPVWSAWSVRTGSDDLAVVAAAWALSERLGAPLATTVATVAAVVRRRREVHRRTAAALAGPRASMTILTALPAIGPVLALAMGLSPTDLYASAPGAAAGGAGLVLLLVGRWWGSRLIASIGVERRAGRVRSRSRPTHDRVGDHAGDPLGDPVGDLGG